jgi:hypothetical protein
MMKLTEMIDAKETVLIARFCFHMMNENGMTQDDVLKMLASPWKWDGECSDWCESEGIY